jgi:hypothetical protein
MAAWSPRGDSLAYTTTSWDGPRRSHRCDPRTLERVFVAHPPDFRPRPVYEARTPWIPCRLENWVTWSPDGRELLADTGLGHAEATGCSRRWP